MEPYEPVADFYAGKSIFITGGTGFLGKVLVEKLLYSCPNVADIHLLIRKKKGISPQDRAKSYFDSPVFDRLKKERSNNLEKIKFVHGDLTESNLGIISADLKVILEEVCIVFHVGASVKFNETLSYLMKVNVEGTKEVLKLCRDMKQIEIFVYMSTIFSNANYEEISIEERLYPSPKTLEEVYRMILGRGENKVFRKEDLGGRPNAYTFTKALAEHIVAKESGNLPTIIIRPSIVTAAKEEPVKGWVCTWTGATPTLFFTGKGFCRTVYGKRDYTLEIIPVDYVINLTIIAAARHNRSKELAIYHSCTSSANPLTLRETRSYLFKACRIQRFPSLPFRGLHFTTSESILAVRRFLLDIMPSYFADFFFVMSRKPGRSIEMQRKVAICASAIKYFTSKRWSLKMLRGQTLFRSLNSEDQNIFPCDPVNIKWENYIDSYLYGIRKYLLKEDL